MWVGKRWGFEGWGPEGVGPRRVGAQTHQTGPAGARTRQPGNSKRAHLSAPALQTPPKFHEKTPRERKKFLVGEGEKRAKFWAVQGRTVQGRAVPGRAVPGGTEHDQQKTLKPPHGNCETNTHKHTHKHTHKRTSRSRFGQSRFWPKSATS